MKKLVSLALAAVLAVSAVGCGSNSDSSSSTADSAQSTEAAADGAAFKIGGIGPITGGAAIYGQADAEKSVNAYNTLKDWGMQMLMGTVTSTPCTAVSAKTEEDNMFQLTPSGSAVESIAPANAFRVCFSDPNQGTASAQYIGENKLASKVAVIYNSSDVYSSGIYQTFATERHRAAPGTAAGRPATARRA